MLSHLALIWIPVFIADALGFIFPDASRPMSRVDALRTTDALGFTFPDACRPAPVTLSDKLNFAFPDASKLLSRRDAMRAAAACLGVPLVSHHKACTAQPADPLTPEQMKEYEKLMEDALRIQGIIDANKAQFEEYDKNLKAAFSANNASAASP